MNKKCPYCQVLLLKNGYIKDIGINNLSFLELITKDNNYRKHHFEINALYCPKCGHIELFADLEKEIIYPKQKN